MPKDYITVVVGTDGSELAVPTVTRATWTATREDVNLAIVCAYNSGSRRADAKMPLIETALNRTGQVPGKEAVTLVVTQVKDIIVAIGVCIKAILLAEADSAEALLSNSKQHLGDLIVIGAICDHSIAGCLLDDVTSVVVRRVHCDVLIIHLVNPDEGEQIHPESGV